VLGPEPRQEGEARPSSQPLPCDPPDSTRGTGSTRASWACRSLGRARTYSQALRRELVREGAPHPGREVRVLAGRGWLVAAITHDRVLDWRGRGCHGASVTGFRARADYTIRYLSAHVKVLLRGIAAPRGLGGRKATTPGEWTSRHSTRATIPHVVTGGGLCPLPTRSFSTARPSGSRFFSKQGLQR